jgi:sulfate transport system permease protein
MVDCSIKFMSQVLAINSSVKAAKPARRPWLGRQILPGYHLSLGITSFYLTALILLPLGALFFRILLPTKEEPTYAALFSHLFSVCFSAQALHSYQLSFGLSALAALINGIFGLATAWILSRYTFFGKRVVDALIDLPFAIPTSVAGIALTQIYSSNGGYLGQLLNEYLGWKVAYTQAGIVIALVFVGYPFVVRTLQPVIASLSVDQEEAAACLGANRWQTLRRVIFPALWSAWLTGVMLAFGRAVGEYGSVVFISGNRPLDTEITPRLIVSELDQFDYTAGAGLGVVMLLISFSVVGLANWIQARNYAKQA